MKIAVIDWTRRDTIARTDSIRLRERLLHEQTFDRDIAEIVGGHVGEAQGGFSAMLGLANASNAADPGTGISAAQRLSAGIGGSFSAGSRDMSAESQQDIVAVTKQRSNLQRSLNSTVVIQAGQAEQNYLATRIVANLNRMHALTIQYYEVLRQLRVTTSFVKRHWALLVPFHPFEFTRDLARRFRAQLEPVLLDRRRAAGFDALERLAVGDKAYAPPSGTGTTGGGTGSGTTLSAGGATSPPDAPAPVTVSRFKLLIESGPQQDGDTAGEIRISLGPRILFQLPRRDKNFRVAGGQFNTATNTTVFETELDVTPVQVAPGAPPTWEVFMRPGSLDPNLDGWDLARIRVQGEIGGKWVTLFDEQPEKIPVPAKFPEPAWSITFPRPADLFNKAGMPGGSAMLSQTNARLVKPHSSASSEADGHKIADSYRKDGIRIFGPITWTPPAPQPASQPQPQPKAEDDETPSAPPSQSTTGPTKEADEVQAALLVNHLNANFAHYNAAAWTAMDPRERRLRIAPAAGIYWDGLGELPVAVIGNHLVFPYQGPLVPQITGEGHPAERSEPAPDVTYVSLPTRGVFAEAHLGHCNGAEVRDITQLWNFDELPVSLLPNIEALKPQKLGDAPRIEQGSLPEGRLKVEATPSVPEPKGVTPVINGLGKGDTFKDMSGLDELSDMLGELIKSAKPPSMDDLIEVKKKVDEAKGKQAEKTGQEGRAPSSRAQAAETGSSLLLDYMDRNLDRFRLLDPSPLQLPQVLHDLDTVGAKPALVPGARRTPPPLRKPDRILIRLLPVDAFGRPVDADLEISVMDRTGTVYESLSTRWRRVEAASGVGRQGWLPELTGLTEGAMSVMATFEPDPNRTSLVARATQRVDYNFARGTRLAIFEVAQGRLEREILVKAGETVEEAIKANGELSASISPSRTANLGAAIKVLELGATTGLSGTIGSAIGGNWNEMKGKSYSTETKLLVTVPLHTITVRRVN